ncbi:nitric oxide-associated protein 1-like [Scleropages formosus]|uniref:Nitric oxide-associated protein 1-like n=1 Tax=Scleropages formosus TaxID=113540 RepID=A0A0P7VHB7_SCLFO|nr:nitric oxide-associated protein 1-like [Scleropages formosus]
MTKSSSAVCGRKTNWSSVRDVGWMARQRFYCAARGRQGTAGRSSERYAWIEPQVEEEFVFLDLSEPADAKAMEVPTGPPAQVDPVMTVERQMERRVPKKSSTEMAHRVLELQVESIREVLAEEPDIEFHDSGYTSVRKAGARVPHRVYGTPDTEVPFSSTCCSGCGAVMHCVDPHLPGYLPSEKYKSLTEEGTLHKAICQRCYLLVHHQKALSIQMSKEEYRNIVKGIHNKKALVLFIVDLLDVPDSIIPDLLDLVGKNKHIVVLGNKIDLLPGDSSSYLKRIKSQLLQYCTDVGISPSSGIKDVHLMSAKTGYGIENLISSLQSSWRYKGDVYLVGTANAGKSTLFNTLLESDYCKSKASDVIHKATISPWPGTTLNLLKFPIINPTPHRMFRRQERLQSIASQTEEGMSPEELNRIRRNSKQGYLVGHVGRTFRQDTQLRRISDVVDFDPDELSFEAKEEGEENRRRRHSKPDETVEFTYNELKDAHWLHDTPGIMKEHDILSLLTEQELKMVVPNNAIVPRTFVLKPGMVLFLGALGRIDYLQGERSCWFSVVVSNLIPVHITSLDKADEIYSKHAGKTLLRVPSGGEERMKDFPPLIPQDFELNGLGDYEAVADVKFSSAGWVAVTAQDGSQLRIRVHAPQGAGLSLRVPPLLPHIINVKGERIRKSPAYKPKRPPALVDNSLSVKGAQRLNLRKRK